jgi:HEAT repeat protein
MIHYCPHCWEDIPEGANPCPHCGATTDETGLPFVDRLLLTLGHPEPTRAGLAIDILAERLREPRAVPPLTRLLNTARDMAILQQAARGLGLLADGSAVPALVQLLENAEAPLIARCEAALSLGRLGGEEAWQALSAAAANPHPSLAEAARQALGSGQGKR